VDLDTLEALKLKNLPPQDEGEPEAISPDEETAGDPDQPDPVAPPSEPPLSEQLMGGFRGLEQRLGQMEQLVARYGDALDILGRNSRMLMNKADTDGFLGEVRDSYQKDPLAAVHRMVNRSQQEIWEAVERRVADAFQDHREAKRLLEAFLLRPENAVLRPYKRQLDSLVRDRGMHLGEAAELMRKVLSDADHKAAVRSVAAKEVRNRAAVESEGDSGATLDQEKELDRVIKKSRNLQEMFDGLQKMKLA
jgi:hypothetical protein